LLVLSSRWFRCWGLPHPLLFLLQPFEDAFSGGRIVDYRVAFLEQAINLPEVSQAPTACRACR
jgi:hypothetical protein